ncbi:MAG: trypsin-like peptidase domain-containing protein [bacterium]
MNNQEQVQKIEAIVNKKPKRGKLKIFLFLLLLVFICCFLVSLTGAFLWYGGHAQGVLCKTVKADSTIWNKLNCKNADVQTSTQGEGNYQYNILDNKGEIVVSDTEKVVVNVVDQASPAVVGIGIKGNSTAADQIIGSGFVITANGLIITNQHVVSNMVDANYYVAIPNVKETIPVEKIYRDEVNDIAIVKINKDKLATVPLGDSDNLKVGQTVIAIGNPLGDLSSTVTVGSISGLNRDVNVGVDYAFSTRTFSDVIQTDAAINPGNSGGPLLNSRGEVIGINFATISGAENLSFALPINRVKSRIAELNKYGDFRIPFMGIEYNRRLVFFNNESTIGDQITKVIAASPAEKAGLRVGDIVIQFNDKSLQDYALLDLIQKSNIGDTVSLAILRNGENQTIKVTIGARSDYK